MPRKLSDHRLNRDLSGGQSRFQLPRFPLGAIVALDDARTALSIAAVDPALRGVLIGAPRGAGKSTLCRSIGPIAAALGRPLVEVPIGVGIDRILGGLDIEQALYHGTKRAAAGLVCEAHGGFLFVDHINLLAPDALGAISAAADAGFLRVEREGLSATIRSEFTLIGAYDPAEGEIDGALADRIALNVIAPQIATRDERALIVEAAEQFARDPAALAARFAGEQSRFEAQLDRASRLRPKVRITKTGLRRLINRSASLGVESNRADWFAMRAAIAAAAMRGSLKVEDQDLVLAIRLVLAPRASHRRSESGNAEASHSHSSSPGMGKQNNQPLRARQPRGAPSEDSTAAGTQPALDTAASARSKSTKLVEMERDSVVDAESSGLRPESLGERIWNRDDSKAFRGDFGKGRRAGSRAGERPSLRGRAAGAIQPAGQRKRANQIAIEATIRAAAPLQRLRGATRATDADQRPEASTSSPKSRTDRRPPGQMGDGADQMPRPGLIITPEDLMTRSHKRRPGTLFIFAIDMSASMAVAGMGQAKGAMIQLLRHAYRCRHKVALVGFRGSRADVLLAPTRSVELASRTIIAMPSGGGTPLAAGLLKARELAMRERRVSNCHVVLLVFTDGRANVGTNSGPHSMGARNSEILAELRDTGARLAAAGIRTLVVAPPRRFFAGGSDQGRLVAEVIGAELVQLSASAKVTGTHEIHGLARQTR